MAYKDETRKKGFLDWNEPERPVTLIEEDEPRQQIGESDLIVVRNRTARLNTLNKHDGNPSFKFKGGAMVDEQNALGAKNTGRVLRRDSDRLGPGR